jgi:predicted protein tyrosine phosphatase
MLIVSSLDAAHSAFERYKPAAVISLLSEEEEVPVFEGMPPEAHYRLYVERESCATSICEAARKRAAEIIDLAANWRGKGDILIHCKRGVARSTAAAFIILCIKHPDTDELTLLQCLRKAAPHADPCPLLVNYADELLSREGRMSDALDDLGPPTTVLSAAPVAIPDDPPRSV